MEQELEIETEVFFRREVAKAWRLYLILCAEYTEPCPCYQTIQMKASLVQRGLFVKEEPEPVFNLLRYLTNNYTNRFSAPVFQVWPRGLYQEALRSFLQHNKGEKRA